MHIINIFEYISLVFSIIPWFLYKSSFKCFGFFNWVADKIGSVVKTWMTVGVTVGVYKSGSRLIKHTLSRSLAAVLGAGHSTSCLTQRPSKNLRVSKTKCKVINYNDSHTWLLPLPCRQLQTETKSTSLIWILVLNAFLWVYSICSSSRENQWHSKWADWNCCSRTVELFPPDRRCRQNQNGGKVTGNLSHSL